MGTIQPVFFSVVYIKDRSPGHPVISKVLNKLQQGNHADSIIGRPGCGRNRVVVSREKDTIRV